MDNSFFITGTDTGIGKTFVTCILMHFINSQKRKVIGMKPIAAGIDRVNGQTANEDVLLLNNECSSELSLEEINTYSFTEPIAPHIAAKKNKIEIDFNKIVYELYRITKQGGVVVWVVGDSVIKGSESGTSFRQALGFIDGGFKLHDTMIYEKSGVMPSKNRYCQMFEYMFVLSKGKPKTFNPLTKINTSAGSKGGNHRHDGENLQPLHTNDGIIKKVGRRTNVWDVACGSMNSKDKISLKHPATFPENLEKDHIVSWTNEGDLVYDCFVGSGTTAKMCLENKRNYIGSEISKEYCEIIQKRLEPLKVWDKFGG